MTRKYKRNWWVRLSLKDIISTIAIFILSLIIIVFFIYYTAEKKKLIKLDDELCPEIINNLSIILIDQTDKFNIFQKTAIRNSIQDIVEKLEKYERIEMFILDAIDQNLLEPIIAICNPGKGKNDNNFTGNKKLKKYNWETKFYNPIFERMNTVLEDQSSNSSPIMEAIQSISLTSMHKYKGARINFFIISDMLQHSGSYSNYSHGNNYKSFKSMKGFKQLYTKLQNVDVSIFYINREGQYQGKNHIMFWEQFFNEMGASLSYVKRIEG